MATPQSQPVGPIPPPPLGAGNTDTPPLICPPRTVPPPITVPVFDLLAEDGEPMDTPWHRSAMNLLIDVVRWHRRGRTDYYVGGNMFIYYGRRQMQTWEYRGPDFFVVDDVDGSRERRTWIVVDEEGRYPNVIVELTSPSTAREDHTTKKDIYERTFRTPDYFCYDPATRRLEGWRLNGSRYQALTPDERGWLWSAELQLWLGTWEGKYLGQPGVWLRFYDPDGQLVPTEAEAAQERAEAERRRADAAEAELARLKAMLADKGMTPRTEPGS